ncbi:MAG: MarC family protein [Anaerolineaceae bacterium]|nr:MarC family protein [Anaerolineaceae bacterium]
MLETAVVAFTTLFATIGPIDAAAVFAALTPDATPRQRRSTAVRGALIATVILVLFALLGKSLLAGLGISLAALRTAGGILLLLIGIDMVFARPSGSTTTTPAETEEATLKQDIAVFPLATPLIAGPGAIGAVILLMANAEGNLLLQGVILLTLLAVLLLTFLALLGAGQIQRVLGVTGLHVISRIFGILLSALAVQFIFDGIGQSGLFQ